MSSFALRNVACSYARNNKIHSLGDKTFEIGDLSSETNTLLIVDVSSQ